MSQGVFFGFQNRSHSTLKLQFHICKDNTIFRNEQSEQKYFFISVPWYQKIVLFLRDLSLQYSPLMSEVLEKKELFCNSLKNTKYKFREYRGYRISALKLLIEYTFSGFAIKVEPNYREFRFDIFLSKKNKETGDNINVVEVEKFRKFYGKGFHIILMEVSI